MHDEARVRFPRVDSGANDHILFVLVGRLGSICTEISSIDLDGGSEFILVAAVHSRSHCEDRQAHSRQTVTKMFFFHMLRYIEFVHGLEVLLKIGESVRNTVSKVHSVVLVPEIIRK